jgi:hypothetical protein
MNLQSAIEQWAPMNANALAQSPGYLACQTKAQQASFLLAYPPFAAIAAAIQTAEDWFVFWTGVDMIVSAVEDAIAEGGIE